MNQNEPKPWYFSWKRLAPLAGILVVALNRKLKLGLNDQEVNNIVWLIIALVTGLSLPDAAGAIAKGMTARSDAAKSEVAKAETAKP